MANKNTSDLINTVIKIFSVIALVVPLCIFFYQINQTLSDNNKILIKSLGNQSKIITKLNTINNKLEAEKGIIEENRGDIEDDLDVIMNAIEKADETLIELKYKCVK